MEPTRTSPSARPVAARPQSARWMRWVAALALSGCGLLGLHGPAAAATAGGSDGDDGPWLWPLQPRPSVVAAFDPPEEEWGAGHRGVDLAGSAGQPVLAIAAGRVTFAGVLAGRGVVVVEHDARRSTYEPVTALVRVGERVEAGDQVGVLSTHGSHCLPDTCLHLGLKRGDVYLDPLALLGGREVRLKPLVGQAAPSPNLAAQTPAAAPMPAEVAEPRSAQPASVAPAVVGGGAGVVSGLLLTSFLRKRGHARG